MPERDPGWRRRLLHGTGCRRIDAGTGRRARTGRGCLAVATDPRHQARGAWWGTTRDRALPAASAAGTSASVVVQNRPGADFAVGTMAAKPEPPDGYTG